ncbi:hypothetical protein DPMN_178606 [Dreissena polymorpha]|uniref:Uncharacterized protein n=1 Tax=Dreissena polymorpha TaxID=45954 RepID=A0A9D4ILC9_DREPO|nr:hypothetical protein DPMN_178606 [Dreissena polymorpha]
MSLQEKANLHALEKIDQNKQSILKKVISSMKPNSVHGGVKTHSSRSSSRRSELIALKQAEAESAKIKLKYTQQEAALLKQKAESEANLQVLSQQKAFEADAAEVKVLQEHDVEGSDGSESHVTTDIKFKLQTLPVVKHENNLVQEVMNKSTNNPTVSDTNMGENLCKFLLKKD